MFILKYQPFELFLICLLFYATLTFLASISGFLLEKSVYGRKHQVWQDRIKEGQLKMEFGAGVRFVLIAAFMTFMFLYKNLIQFQAGSGISFVLTFALLFFVFEVWYYFLHRLFHLKTFFRFHRLHHLSLITTPLSGISFSLVEAFAWMMGYTLFPAFISRFVSLDFNAWYIFISYHWFMNIFGHINVEILPDAMNARFITLFSHPITYHAFHHARGNVHFSLYTSFLDRWFKTELAGWENCHRQVNSGTPMVLGQENRSASRKLTD